MHTVGEGSNRRQNPTVLDLERSETEGRTHRRQVA